MEEEAKNILQRANDANISISSLCKKAGVSRGWFEKLKKRTPSTINAYLAIEKVLIELETNKINEVCT